MAEKEIQTHKDGVLTLDGMKAAIDAGGSVQMRDGRVITKLEELPKASELTRDDPQAARDALAQLQKLQREQAVEIEQLKANAAAKTEPDKPPAA